MKNSSITIRDIATKSGVSIATVSRVINQSDQVTEATKQRVQAIIEQLNYKPNAIARSLYTKKSNVIGCILPDITNHYFARIYLEIERAAYEHGYTMFMCNSMNRSELETVYLNKLIEQQVDSIIFMGGRVNECQPKPKEIEELKAAAAVCPVVVINGEIDDDRIYLINTDEVAAVERMVSYLMDNNHSKLGMVGGIKGVTVTDDKMKVFKRACLRRGLTEADFFVEYGGFSFKSGVEALTNLYQQDKLPQAVIGINDEVTAGILHGCIKHGIQVPEQLSVIGYDNTDLAEYTYPQMTAYSHPYAKLATFAIETIERLYIDNLAVNRQLLRGELIERASVSRR